MRTAASRLSRVGRRPIGCAPSDRPSPGGARPAGGLAGRRVLVVEDEALIAMAVVAEIEEAGGAALTARCAPTAHVVLDAAAADGGVAGAVLDLDLRCHSSEEVARRLARAGVPFVLHTGNPGRWRSVLNRLDAPVVVKPAPPGAVVTALARALWA